MCSESNNGNLSTRQTMAFLAMVVGMFMAILDIQIVSSSISVIGAGLSASSDELSWVQTAYLITEVIIIPITGFLARLLSTRIAYAVAALGFTVMSCCCSFAWSINSMIFFRCLQGLFGGAMIPTVFGTVYLVFPPEKRASVTVLIGLVVTIAPTVGPTLGGYITELLSWHFMFLINIVPGIIVCVTVFLYADFDKPNYKLLRNFDYLGIIAMASSLGTLQYILEEGNKKGWMEDTLILCLSIGVFCTLVFFVFRELNCRNPIMDLTALRNKNFSLGCVYSFVLGMGLYNAIYLLPLFLSTVAKLNTLQIGLAMMVGGIAQFCSAPLAGKMVASGTDLRLVLILGLVGFGLGCYLDAFLTPDSSMLDFVYSQLVRGLSIMFCFIPINNLALGTISRDQIQNASGIYNLTRNLGGAIGLALVNTALSNKFAMAVQYINENISYTDSSARDRLSGLSYILEGKVSNPEAVAKSLLSNQIMTNAFTIAINDMFMILGMCFFASILVLPFMSRVDLSQQNDVH